MYWILGRFHSLDNDDVFGDVADQGDMSISNVLGIEWICMCIRFFLDF